MIDENLVFKIIVLGQQGRLILDARGWEIFNVNEIHKKLIFITVQCDCWCGVRIKGN